MTAPKRPSTPEELFDKIEGLRKAKREKTKKLNELEASMKDRLDRDDDLDKQEFLDICTLRKDLAELQQELGRLN